MTVLVTDAGFVPDTWRDGYVPLSALSDHGGLPGRRGVEIGSPELTRSDWARLCRMLPLLDLVRVRLRHFGDTAALDLASAVRAQGYAGRLRAHGAVLAGLYTLARRSGFDEVELVREQARLQPCEHWRNEIGWHPVARRGGGQVARQDAL